MIVNSDVSKSCIIALFLNISLIFRQVSQIIKLASRRCHPEALNNAGNENVSHLLLL